MRNKEAILQLKAELKSDYEFIRECAKKNVQMTERIDNDSNADEFDIAALGYTLHNLYNSFESYFLRISRFFENNLASSGWHRELVERMQLEIPELRPALISKAFALKVDELLRFRNVFRNVYQAPLIPEKVLDVNGYAVRIGVEFRPFHEKYLDFLDDLLKEYNKLDE